MGNRQHCLSRTARRGKAPILPDQDPLLRSVVTRRIVRAEIGRDFEIQPQVLGTGYSGAVRLAVHRGTRQRVAVKQFAKRRLKPHRLKLLQSEVTVYLGLDHPNVCRLLHAYEGHGDVWLVMELCGCELYGRLCERKVYHESDAADVMLQMLQALNYLHSHCIVHRDLKLENWMYSELEGDDRLKLIDFGFSQRLGAADETLDMPCGTLHYTSPEVLTRKYTSQCDLWSLGVICYMLLLGRPPFRGTDNLKIAKAILQGDFQRDSRWEALSSNAKDFLECLLQKDAGARLDAPRALQHPWVTGAGSFPSPDVGVDVLQSLRRFAKGSHLRRAALTVMAYSLTSRELQDLEQTFLAFDKSGRGIITLDQLAEVMHENLEVSSQEVQRIFACFDFANDEEMHYTPFIAALLATRVKLHEDKVRTAFEAFDHEGKGFITAESLLAMFSGWTGPSTVGCVNKEEAEAWISEVDYKGNGTVGYEEFLSALVGKNLWSLPPADGDDDLPCVRVFDSGSEARPRGLSESFAGTLAGVSRSLASAIIDRDIEDRRSQSFTPGLRLEPELQFRTVSCGVDDNYFA
mmetsp:Transcript_929/g.2600  ORF Transcript_929/g.2600 Transcript_929/m.2600 type:complete len:576 (+) Transcript_929:66-1793(+)